MPEISRFYDVIAAEYAGEYRIKVTFENGRSGVVDLGKYIKRGGVFSKLKDDQFFKAFKINSELGTITWADEIDLAPETLYSEAVGAPLPTWTQPLKQSA